MEDNSTFLQVPKCNPTSHYSSLPHAAQNTSKCRLPASHLQKLNKQKPELKRAGDQKGELSGPNRAQQEEDRLRFPPVRTRPTKSHSLSVSTALPTSCLSSIKDFFTCPVGLEEGSSCRPQDATLCGSQRNPPLW